MNDIMKISKNVQIALLVERLFIEAITHGSILLKYNEKTNTFEVISLKDYCGCGCDSKDEQ